LFSDKSAVRIDDFRGTKRGPLELVAFDELVEAEVGDFRRQALEEEDVRGLEIAVEDAARMEEFHPGGDAE
jgi:hypothetical protein